MGHPRGAPLPSALSVESLIFFPTAARQLIQVPRRRIRSPSPANRRHEDYFLLVVFFFAAGFLAAGFFAAGFFFAVLRTALANVVLLSVLSRIGSRTF
jgi:hypothetical protein